MKYPRVQNIHSILNNIFWMFTKINCTDFLFWITYASCVKSYVKVATCVLYIYILCSRFKISIRIFQIFLVKSKKSKIWLHFSGDHPTSHLLTHKTTTTSEHRRNTPSQKSRIQVYQSWRQGTWRSNAASLGVLARIERGRALPNLPVSQRRSSSTFARVWRWHRSSG